VYIFIYGITSSNSMADKPDVLVLATGGTIANPRDIEGYLDGETPIEEVPEVEEVANIEVKDVASTESSGMSPEIWWDLHRETAKAANRDNPPAGVVITHGSNTVEETAYFLHLTLSTEMPVTLTAAQRNHRLVGNDGDRNLVDAVKVATSEEARGRGAMIILNDEIHTARDVTKYVTGRPDAWGSGNLGVLGLIDKRDNMEFFRETDKRGAPDSLVDPQESEYTDFPDIRMVYSVIGQDGSMIEAPKGDGADGVVVAALPTGSPSDPTIFERTQADVVQEVSDELPIALSSRAYEGWPYPTRRDEFGFIWANTLSPQKARTLLALGLLKTDDREQFQEYFEQF
jgi:L-asparaginase